MPLDQEQLFEGLVDPAVSSTDVATYQTIGLLLRDETWVESIALPQVYELGMRLGLAKAVEERFRRARIMGLASNFFLQIAPIEQEVRAFVREQLIARGLWRNNERPTTSGA